MEQPWADPRPALREIRRRGAPRTADVSAFVAGARHAGTKAFGEDAALQLRVGRCDVVQGFAERRRRIEPRFGVTA